MKKIWRGRNLKIVKGVEVQKGFSKSDFVYNKKKNLPMSKNKHLQNVSS